MKSAKEIKIALVAVLGIVILFIGLNFLKGLNIFSNDESYKMSFKDISGLSASSPIYADGYKVGTVKSINYDYNHEKDIIVDIGIDPDLRIPKGSSAEIVSDLMGNVQVNLLLANNVRERVNPGEIIEGSINNGSMGELKAMIPTIEKMLPKLDSILLSLNTVLSDPAIAKTLHNVENISGNLTTTSRQLNTLMASLNKEVPGMIKRANGVLENTQELTANLKSVDVNATMEKVNATLDNVHQLTSQLNSNEGTLGLLMRDPSLYNNLNTTMSDADSLLVNLKAHPKRYVHFSIFGRKDK